MKNILLLIATLLILVACAPSAQAIQIAIAQTQAAFPTPTIEPTTTPLPDIKSVLLANGFALGSTHSYSTGKQYVDEQKAISLSAVVYDSGMVSISAWVLGENEKGKIGNILLSAYGPTVSNWVAAIIESKDFSQTFDKSDTVGGSNIDISISGEVGMRKLNITLTPSSKSSAASRRALAIACAFSAVSSANSALVIASFTLSIFSNNNAST